MPRIVSIASGKGGVGKSTLAASLARLLARSGLRTILIDLDVGGANSHLLFGTTRPSVTLTDFLEHRVDSLGDAVLRLEAFSGLGLIVGTGETLRGANPLHSTKQRIARQVRKLDADVVVVDVGAGTNLDAIDFFLLSDLPIGIATPDQMSVTDLARFLRLATMRRVTLLLSAALESGRTLATELATRAFSSTAELREWAQSRSPEIDQLVGKALAGFRPQVVLNRTRASGSLSEFRLSQLLRSWSGAAVPVLGRIPEDSAIEAAVAAFLPVVDWQPDAPASVALVEIAEKLRMLLAEDEPAPLTRAAAAS